MSLWIGIGGFVVIAVIAHSVAYRLASFRSCRIGHGREVMPTLPTEESDGDPGRRWIDGVRRTERKILNHLKGDTRGVSALQLTAELGEPRQRIVAALERIREEIPCRLRVTRGGELLHDFEADDLDELRRQRRRNGPFRLFAIALAALANVGAIWPVLMVLFIALTALDLLLTVGTDVAVIQGMFWLLIVAGVVLVAAVGRVIIRWVFTPIIASPPLDKPDGEDDSSSFLHTPIGFGSGSSTSGRRRRRSGGSGGSGGGGGGGGAAIAHAFLVLVFLAIVIACLLTILVWIAGLFRAVVDRKLDAEKQGPAAWTRHDVEPSAYERYLPTNDLVSRLLRSVRRTLRTRRPRDAELSGRIADRAHELNGRISALDIALSEGLSLADSVDIGTRLCRRFDGELLIADNGELVFDFDASLLENAEIPAGPDFEFLDRRGGGLGELVPDFPLSQSLPVNMVGLTFTHLRATNALVIGSLMMFWTALFAFYGIDPTQISIGLIPLPTETMVAIWDYGFWIVAAVFLFATGTATLAATTRYLAKQLAVQGVQRDARRVFGAVLRDAVESGDEWIDFTPWNRRIADLFGRIDDYFDAEFARDECIGFLIDIGLEDRVVTELRGLNPIPLEDFRNRLSEAKTAPATDVTGRPVDTDDTTAGAEEDEVIFDTESKPERIRALG